MRNALALERSSGQARTAVVDDIPMDRGDGDLHEAIVNALSSCQPKDGKTSHFRFSRKVSDGARAELYGSGQMHPALLMDRLVLDISVSIWCVYEYGGAATE